MTQPVIVYPQLAWCTMGAAELSFKTAIIMLFGLAIIWGMAAWDVAEPVRDWLGDRLGLISDETGAVDSFIGMITLWAVACALYLQAAAAKNSQKAAFETLFFQLLARLSQIQADVRYEEPDGKNEVQQKHGSIAADRIRDKFAAKFDSKAYHTQRDISEAFRSFLRDDLWYTELFPFAATVEIIFDQLEKHRPILGGELQNYIHIARSQINSSWLALLLLYALDPKEKRLKEIIDKCNLTENMHPGPVRQLCAPFYRYGAAL